MTGTQCETYKKIVQHLEAAAHGLRHLQAEIHGCFGNLATAVEETAHGVLDVWEVLSMDSTPGQEAWKPSLPTQSPN